MTGFRHGADFSSQGVRCDASLYLPAQPDDPPVVVMAHGFAAEKSWRLPQFARAFNRRGVAAFVFDYRGFGESDGDPRRVVSPKRHVEDWTAAVAAARESRHTGDAVALWGTSYSAGHALTAAGREADAGRPVDALVMQLPFLDGRATVLRLMREGGVRWSLKATTTGLRDLLRSVMPFRKPLYAPVVGEPDAFALLNRPGCLDGYRSLVPEDERTPDGGFPNECTARAGLQTLFYRPITHAASVDCPTLVVQADDDQLCPPGPVDAVVSRLDDVERVRYDIDHFAPYTGADFERVVAREGDFLARHLTHSGLETPNASARTH